MRKTRNWIGKAMKKENAEIEIFEHLEFFIYFQFPFPPSLLSRFSSCFPLFTFESLWVGEKSQIKVRKWLIRLLNSGELFPRFLSTKLLSQTASESIIFKVLQEVNFLLLSLKLKLIIFTTSFPTKIQWLANNCNLPLSEIIEIKWVGNSITWPNDIAKISLPDAPHCKR